MKVLMLNPPYFKRFTRQSRSPCVAKGGTFYYPYMLAYATGALENKTGFEVKLVDAVANDWDRAKTLDFVKSFAPDLVVMDTSTPSIKNDVEVANEIKAALPDVHVTLVGTHPTALPEETLRMGSVDSVCIDEFDYTVVDLAKALDKEKDLSTVRGLAYRIGGMVKKNEPRERIANLDELPWVSKVYAKHLNIKKYFYASLRHPQLTLLTARGCPYNCAFCNSPFKASYRPRSVKDVVDEIEFIRKEMPWVKELMLEDETFPAQKKRTIELCDGIIKRGIKMRWSCNARVNTDLETLQKMRQAGCRLMCVGFESPTQDVLDAIHKGTTKDLQVEFMKNANAAKLLVNGCFILGLPTDTPESMRGTIEFAKLLNPDTIQMYPLMVYPGTEAYKWATKNGYLETEDYSKWLTPEGLMRSTVSRPEMSHESVEQMCKKALKEYYFRPRFILYKAKQGLTNWDEGKRTLKSFFIFIKNLRK